MTPPQIELRFSASNLANKDFLSLSDPFLVCHILQNNSLTECIGYTETVRDDLNPTWTTTISFAHTPDTANATLQLDIFDRDSDSDSRLSKHDFLGRAILRLDTLLTTSHKTLHLPLSAASSMPTNLSFSSQGLSRSIPQSWSSLATSEDDDTLVSQPTAPDLRRATTTQRAMKNVKGTLTIYAETLSPNRGLPIVFQISSAHLRDVGALGRRVTQFYELQRERDTPGGSQWTCIYRSKDGLQVDRNNYIIFDDLCITEQQLHNHQPNRRLRLAFYKRHMRSQHELISYAITSMSQIMSVQTPNYSSSQLETQPSIPLEGKFGDEDGLGHVIIENVQTRGHQDDILVQLRADHFLHKRFVSSLNDQPTRGRRLRQIPSFFSRH